MRLNVMSYVQFIPFKEIAFFPDKNVQNKRFKQKYLFLWHRKQVLLVEKDLTFPEDGPDHIKPSLLICRADTWTGFYMIRTSVMMKEIRWTEVHLGHYQTSLMEYFCENSQRVKGIYFFLKISIIDIW